MTLTIPSIDNQYVLRTPAHRFRQGGRDVYSFPLDLATLDGLLPQRVDEDVIKDANRRLTPSHAKKIQGYLVDRSDWILGALLLGIAPDAVEFIPGKDENGRDSDLFGELRILTNRANTLKIFDGQHRRRAIADALSESQQLQLGSDRPDQLVTASVPIVLYAEDDIKSLRQMFADASKTKTIESNTVTRFDERDAFNLAAMWLSDNSDLFSGRVEMERTTVPRSSECLVAINQLAKTLRTLDVGYKGRVSKDRNDGHLLEPEALYERCLEWADGFMVAARSEYDHLVAGEIDNSEIPHFRSTSFAFNATVIRMMAGCYYEWVKNGDDWGALADFFRGQSLERRSSDNTLLHEAGIIAVEDTVLASTPIVSRAVDHIVGAAKLSK